MSAKKTDQGTERVDRLLILENAKIIYRNFSGKITKYNQSGFRTFNVLIPNDIAEELLAEGWNVKYLRPQEEGDPPQAHMEVKIQYDPLPPKVTLVSGRNQTPMDEDTIGSLDYAEIKSADIVIRPYHWTVKDASGIKAYLKTLWVVLEVDPFAHKYAAETGSL